MDLIMRPVIISQVLLPGFTTLTTSSPHIKHLLSKVLLDKQGDKHPLSKALLDKQEAMFTPYWPLPPS